MADPIQLPQSGGGLVRYNEDVKSKISISPITVLVLIVLVIALEALLHAKIF